MIIKRVFQNDDNRLLKDVQHDEYMRSVVRIFNAARAELAHADAIIGSNLLIVEKARATTAFDHRVLQDAHDIMAAAYRYRHDDGGQMQLFGDPDKQKDEYLRAWVDWLSEQLTELIRSPQFVRSVVECVIFANSVMGHAAEARLGDFLLEHYSAGDWAFPDGYLKVYPSIRS